MTARARQLLALVPATGRRAPWTGAAACLAAALGITWLVTSYPTATTGQILTTLRWSAVLLAAGVAGVLDDPTEEDLAGAGLPVWPRRLLALLLLGVPTAGGWAVAVTMADQPLPWAALSLEAAALVLAGVAVASLRRLRTSSIPAGLAAAPLPAVILVIAPFLPTGWALLADPADVQGWRDVHQRWALLAVAAAVAIAITARDPARRAAWRLIRPARPRPRPPRPRRPPPLQPGTRRPRPAHTTACANPSHTALTESS